MSRLDIFHKVYDVIKDLFDTYFDLNYLPSSNDLTTWLFHFKIAKFLKKIVIVHLHVCTDELISCLHLTSTAAG